MERQAVLDTLARTPSESKGTPIKTSNEDDCIENLAESDGEFEIQEAGDPQDPGSEEARELFTDFVQSHCIVGASSHENSLMIRLSTSLSLYLE